MEMIRGLFAFVVAIFLVCDHIGICKQVHGSKTCNVYKGRWVYDPSYPLYNATTCSFLPKMFNCQGNGRPDNLYQKYRWQPISCNLPRFNGERFLERFRGKRILFVGDSLGLNQWQSLTCMLHASVHQANYTSKRINVALSIFNFLDYGVSIMFVRNAYLVDIVNDKKYGRLLKLNSITTGELWKSVDVVIFNTWHWWLYTERNQIWDYVQDGNVIRKDMNRMVAYETALRTWAKWVNNDINPAKTKVFFQGVSPDHADSREWADPTAKTCKGETNPMTGTDYPGGTPRAQLILRRVLRTVSKPVHLLDITRLSQLRKDGHPSAFGYGGHRGNDCTHWCLPGVSDAWNQLLYTALTQN